MNLASWSYWFIPNIHMRDSRRLGFLKTMTRKVVFMQAEVFRLKVSKSSIRRLFDLLSRFLNAVINFCHLISCLDGSFLAQIRLSIIATLVQIWHNFGVHIYLVAVILCRTATTMILQTWYITKNSRTSSLASLPWQFKCLCDSSV